jgi:hypothetical protein
MNRAEIISMQAETLTATVLELVTTLELNERDVTAVFEKERKG